MNIWQFQQKRHKVENILGEATSKLLGDAAQQLVAFCITAFTSPLRALTSEWNRLGISVQHEQALYSWATVRQYNHTIMEVLKQQDYLSKGDGTQMINHALTRFSAAVFKSQNEMMS